MSNVLLVLPLGSQPPRAADYAIEQARRLGGQLIGLVILDPAETARVASSLDSAFMGDRVSDRVLDLLTREAHTRAEAQLQTIGEKAAQGDVSFAPLIEQGDPTEVCARIIRIHNVVSAVLVAEKRSWLTRFLSRSAAVNLPALAGCEVKVMEE